MRLTVLLLLLVEFATAGASAEGESDKVKLIHLSLGSVTFEAPVNIKALSIHGKANQLTGSLLLDGLNLKEINIKIPINSLSTGMKVRDKHMRQRIFQTEDRKFLDIEFFTAWVIVPVNETIWNVRIRDFLKYGGCLKKSPCL